MGVLSIRTPELRQQKRPLAKQLLTTTSQNRSASCMRFKAPKSGEYFIVFVFPAKDTSIPAQMHGDTKKVRFKETAVLYYGRAFVVKMEVPLQPSDEPMP